MQEINIYIDIRTEKEFKKEYKKIIKSVAKKVLELEKFYQDTEVSISIVDSSEIRAINKKFRKIDKETDVLSFPLQTDFNLFEFELGDIVISIDKLLSQAKEYGHSIERELGFLTAHSMLHLLGYDHINKDEEKIMIERQELALNALNLLR